MPFSQSSPSPPAALVDVSGPSTFWLGAGFLLAGLGTVLLGPILPTVSKNWALTDAAAGSLLFAKFLGAFAGGATVPSRLRIGILSGMLLTAAGLTGFAFSLGLRSALAALAVLGFGLGRLIASSNILAGRRYVAHTGSALSTFNFFWSLGAVGTGLLSAWLLPNFRLPVLLLSTAIVFLIAGSAGASNWLLHRDSQSPGTADETRRLGARTFFFFAALLLIYGGLETSLSSWLPTFEQRYLSGSALLAGQSALVLLWVSITAGRMLASAALRQWTETRVLRLSLASTVALVLLLAAVHGSLALSIVCVLLGLSLAPWFPATFALLLHRGPTSREAGTVLAASGIGAAVFPWLTGILSTFSGSLRIGMSVPAALALLLLVASFVMKPTDQSNSPSRS